MERIKKLFKNYIEYTGLKFFIFSIFFGLISAFIAIMEPLFFGQVISSIENFLKTGNFELGNFLKTIFFWIGLIIITLLAGYIYSYYIVSKKLTIFYMEQVKRFSKKILSYSYSELLSKKSGSTYKILDRGTNNEYVFLDFFYIDIVKSMGGIAMIITVLFVMNWKMAFISLSMLPFLFLFGYFFYKKLYPVQKKINDEWEIVYANLGNGLTNFSLLKSLTLENTFYNKITDNLLSASQKQNGVNKLWAINQNYTGVLIMISRLLVLGFGIYFITKGELSLAELFVIFSYLGWIYFPLGALIGRLKNIQEEITSIEKLYDEVKKTDKEDLETGKALEKINGKLEIKNIFFGYSEEKDILKDISINIKPGEKIALVGNSGAGKSTIFNTILRFVDIKKGSIEIDGVNINELSKNFLRNSIGLVSQDSSLFNMSIKENLLLAKPKASIEEISEALKTAQAQFVFDLKDGIDTIIGERGLKLSGGEKQRISIARLILKNPQILLLDEATSALDNKTEILIQTAFDNLMKDKTSIIIAHRLSTIQNVDKIYMIEDGKIIEFGKYDELMNKKGSFYELANPKHLVIN